MEFCHCGASFPTYHGLRVHQGRMGCTPKGMRIPQQHRELSLFNPAVNYDLRPRERMSFAPKQPVRKNSDLKVTPNTPDMSLQVCHCGWSKVTTYHGLRIHQGKMGCTTRVTAPPKKQEEPVKDTSSTPKKSVVENQKQSKQLGGSSVFQTPQRSQPTTTKLEKACRALDFSTGAQQVQQTYDFLFQHHDENQNQFNPMNPFQQMGVGFQPIIAACPNEKELERERERERQRELEAQRQLKARQDCKRAELQQKLKSRENQVSEVRSSVKVCEVSLDAEFVEINSAFSEVIKLVEDARQKALQPLEEKRQKVKREEQALVQKLEREIDKLKKSIEELDKNPDVQISLDEPGDVSVDTSFSFGTLRTTTSAMMEEIRQKLETLCFVELIRIPTFAVDVKLDSTTAHEFLVLSDDGKEVRDGGKAQGAPDSPKRFDMYGSILGLNSFISGRSYWEVEVSSKTSWGLGVARGDANRKGKLSLNPDNGYWVMAHCEMFYAALSAPPVSLSLKQKPQKVGVFVDYEEGLLSFYDVTTRSHIYSFTECSFGGEIFPYFSPHLKQNGKNSEPLIISAVETQKCL